MSASEPTLPTHSKKGQMKGMIGTREKVIKGGTKEGGKKRKFGIDDIKKGRKYST